MLYTRFLFNLYFISCSFFSQVLRAWMKIAQVLLIVGTKLYIPEQMSMYLLEDATDDGLSLNSEGGLAIMKPSSSLSWDLFLLGGGENAFLWELRGVEVATGPPLKSPPTSSSPPATVLLRTNDPLSKLTCFCRLSSSEMSGVLATLPVSTVSRLSFSSSTLRLGWNLCEWRSKQKKIHKFQAF